MPRGERDGFDASELLARAGKRLPPAGIRIRRARRSDDAILLGNLIDGDYLWYGDNSLVDYPDGKGGKGTHPVGLKKPNGFGLYDMAGNVWSGRGIAG